MQFAVVEPAKRDRILVAHFAAKGARLGKAEMVRFTRPAATVNARLSGDELAVFLIAQADSLRCDATGGEFLVSGAA